MSAVPMNPPAFRVRQCTHAALEDTLNAAAADGYVLVEMWDTEAGDMLTGETLMCVVMELAENADDKAVEEVLVEAGVCPRCDKVTECAGS